jgi:ubiquinone/menaquinone biosynthesis C-methylase UbiE
MISTSDTLQEEAVNTAFSKQSALFDALDADNPTLQWMRNRVRKHLLGRMKPGASILELNAGTGLDAVYFSENGFFVHATDNAPGMISEMEKKAKELQLGNRLTVQRCSFNQLHELKGRTYDHIFSNFGGLNCASDLAAVIRQFDNLLNPGGSATLVVMPPVCPWEIASALKGNFKMAFRRFKKGGTPSHLEGATFKTYYYSPGKLKMFFGNKYKLMKLVGLGIFVPPPYKEHFAKDHPGLFRFLTKSETALAGLFPFHSWADHYILTMKRTR